jgi:D-lactate dehydrogenase
LTFETSCIIDRKSLDIMKDGAIIINTSRGKLIRTDEVVAALKSGKLGGCALDVYENEENIFFKDHGS